MWQQRNRRAGQRFLDDLASLFGSIGAVKGAAPQSEPSRLRLLAGLAVLVSNLTRHSPVILLIDDAHDADPSSWETVRYLTADPPSARLLVVAAARSYEVAGLKKFDASAVDVAESLAALAPRVDLRDPALFSGRPDEELAAILERKRLETTAAQIRRPLCRDRVPASVKTSGLEIPPAVVPGPADATEWRRPPLICRT